MLDHHLLVHRPNMRLKGDYQVGPSDCNICMHLQDIEVVQVWLMNSNTQWVCLRLGYHRHVGILLTQTQHHCLKESDVYISESTIFNQRVELKNLEVHITKLDEINSLDDFQQMITPHTITYPCLGHFQLFSPFLQYKLNRLIFGRLTKLKILILVLVNTSPCGFDNPDLLVHYITCTARALAVIPRIYCSHFGRGRHHASGYS